MISTAVPVITIGVAIVLAYLCAIGFDVQNMMAPQNMSLGLYGIGIAAVGMLSTLVSPSPPTPTVLSPTMRAATPR